MKTKEILIQLGNNKYFFYQEWRFLGFIPNNIKFNVGDISIIDVQHSVTNITMDAINIEAIPNIIKLSLKI